MEGWELQVRSILFIGPLALLFTVILLVSGTILNNVLYNGLKGKVSPEVLSQLVSSAFNLDDLGISTQDKAVILAVYMRGLRAVFISYAVLASIYFLCSLLVKDYGLGGKECVPKNVALPCENSEERDT